MADNWFSRNPLRMLSEESVGRVHSNVITLLATTGVRIDSLEALDLLAGYGVRCDRERMRVFPEEARVSKALSTVRKAYRLYGRKPGASPPLDINTSGSHIVSGGAALRMYSGGAYTDATIQDLINITVLHEKLENIAILFNVVEPPTLDKATMYPTLAAYLFCYSSKPLLLQVGDRNDLARIIRMAALIADDAAALREKPLFMTGINAEPPLHITREGAEVLIDAARAGIPVSLGCYLMTGATGPLHIAASLIQRTATVLTGLILTQAAAPGSVYDFSAQSGCCNLKTGDAVTMCPDAMLLSAGSIQIGRHYGLVTHSLACTEARGPDAQASGERYFAVATSLMAGASLIQHGTSCMAGMELADPAQSVIDNEIAGHALSFASGISFDGLDEAVSTIHDVVSDSQYAGLFFMGHPHTARNCRMRAFDSPVFAAGQLSRWLAGPRESVYEKAEKKAAELLSEKEEFVSPELKKELFSLAEAG